LIAFSSWVMLVGAQLKEVGVSPWAPNFTTHLY
jgi:hypothetical protein